MKALSNKVALITGASSGIGRASALLFAQQGAKVVVGARRQTELNQLVDEITQAGGEAVTLAGDVTNEAYSKALVELAIHKFGGLDIALNNAGMLGASKPAAEITKSQWENTIHTNLTGAFFGAKHQLPAMTSGGSLIFTSSFVGYTVGFPQTADYAASKAGLIGLTKALAAEFGPMGIRVNALLPGGTDTPMSDQFGDSPEVVEFVNGIHALKRQATPDEIAHSALYLASEMSSFTTGTAMLVDGGVSINKT